MNQGAPVLETEPRSTLGRAFSELVDRFVPTSNVVQPVAPATGLFRRNKEQR